ncbi:DUF4870 family protein [Paenalcaligenes hominis]|uniref:DUF4870 family protein n=1 Tax=Paenalcaligenes hominis TaxID=643674 RepID=UPI003523DCED
MNPIVDSGRTNNNLKQLTMIIYILYLLSVFMGVTALAAIIINYLKRDEVVGTYLETHFRWQMRTFWFGLLWAVLGVLSISFIIGIFILIANSIWLLYRMLRGLLALNDNKAMYSFN